MEEKNLLDYWLVLYKKKGVILFIILSAMITAGIISKIIPPVYEAKVVFFVPNTPDVISYLSPSSGKTMTRSPLVPITSEEPHAPYIGILKSRAIAELVQKRFPHKTIRDLKKDVGFSLTNEYMIQVYARDRDPINAAGIANAFVKYFNQLLSEYSIPILSKNQAMIEKEIEDARGRLTEARQALQEFQEQNKVPDMRAEIRELISLKTGFQSKLEATEVTRREIESQIATLKKQIKKEAALYTSSDFVFSSPILEKLRMELAEVEMKMAGLKAKRTQDTSQEFLILKNQYSQIKKNINTEIRSMLKSQIKKPDTFYETIRQQLTNLLVEGERTQASLLAYKTVIDGIEERIQKIPELIARMDSLRMDIERNETILKALEMNLEETKMQGKRELQVVVVVDEAKPPSDPSFPIPWLNVLVAGMAGLIGGIFYSFFVSFLEETRSKRIYRLIKAIEASEEVRLDDK
ncbi:MAG: GumC family protein [Candidatus Hodarchaeota archaeon]